MTDGALTLLYDGSAAAFFTAVFRAYESCRADNAVITADGGVQDAWGGEIIRVQTDAEAARRVRAGIKKRTGADGLSAVEKALRSGRADKEKIILAYLRRVFDNTRENPPAERGGNVRGGNDFTPYGMTRTARGGTASARFNDPRAIAFNDIVRETDNEIHRFKGFCRFYETASGVMYCQIEPDNDILSFLMPHFCDRYLGRPFGIYDKKRALLGLYDGRAALVRRVEIEPTVELADGELSFQKMWKRYYDDMEIAGRKNSKLRSRCMPRRYWKNLPEVNPDLLNI